MTTLNTIIEEEKKEFDEIVKKTNYTRYMGGGRFCCGGDYCDEGHNEWIKGVIVTAIQRAYGAGEQKAREEVEGISEFNAKLAINPSPDFIEGAVAMKKAILDNLK